jgi:cytochrome P450
MVSDLRAISHIIKHTDVYQKPPALSRFLIRLISNNVLLAEDDPHRIQRKIMNPAFGPNQLRGQTGYFRDTANEVTIILSTLSEPLTVFLSS